VIIIIATEYEFKEAIMAYGVSKEVSTARA
jgi:hypothetical protein